MNEFELESAANVCKIYFDIASEALGEKEVRRRFAIKLNQEIKNMRRRKNDNRMENKQSKAPNSGK